MLNAQPQQKFDGRELAKPGLPPVAGALPPWQAGPVSPHHPRTRRPRFQMERRTHLRQLREGTRVLPIPNQSTTAHSILAQHRHNNFRRGNCRTMKCQRRQRQRSPWTCKSRMWNLNSNRCYILAPMLRPSKFLVCLSHRLMARRLEISIVQHLVVLKPLLLI